MDFRVRFAVGVADLDRGMPVAHLHAQSLGDGFPDLDQRREGEDQAPGFEDGRGNLAHRRHDEGGDEQADGGHGADPYPHGGGGPDVPGHRPEACEGAAALCGHILPG